jgi:hypothetical protein
MGGRSNPHNPHNRHSEPWLPVLRARVNAVESARTNRYRTEQKTPDKLLARGEQTSRPADHLTEDQRLRIAIYLIIIDSKQVCPFADLIRTRPPDLFADMLMNGCARMPGETQEDRGQDPQDPSEDTFRASIAHRDKRSAEFRCRCRTVLLLKDGICFINEIEHE